MTRRDEPHRIRAASRRFEAPFGSLTLFATPEALVALSFPGQGAPASVIVDAGLENAAAPLLERACAELAEYFAGARRVFTIPLEPVGTPFQLQAWQALGRIPFGETRSYGWQAASMGRPKASRAVGGANGRNPISVLVPCHRVIGADGALTGFGAGLDTKRWLLDHEAKVMRAG